MLRGSPLASGTLSRKPGHRVREPFHLDFKALLTTFLSVFMLFHAFFIMCLIRSHWRAGRRTQCTGVITCGLGGQ